MIHPIQLYDVAKLHQRDVEKEIASRQISNQVTTSRISKPGAMRRNIMISFYSTRENLSAKAGEAISK
jgi:hypothetical protein